jgi:hypothetical protein
MRFDFTVKAKTANVCNSDEKDTSNIDIPVAAGIAATAETPAAAGEASNNRDAIKSSKAKHQLVGKQDNCDKVKQQEY